MPAGARKSRATFGPQDQNAKAAIDNAMIRTTNDAIMVEY
jgi:hypothetical protein